MKNKPVWYYDEVFRQNFYFFHKWNEQKFRAYLKKHFKYEVESRGYGWDGVTIRLPEHHQIVVWTNNNKHALPNLVHEITHATNMVLSNADAHSNNDETQAYYNSMLFRKAMK